MPRFSIIFPVYNVSKYLKKSLESIKKQTFKDFECICIDDCSTDNSLSILKSYTSRDSRFKIIEHTENTGISKTRNDGMDAASGDYYVFIDSDDWVELSMLKKLNEIIETVNPDSIWFNAYTYDESTHKTNAFYKGEKRNDLVSYIGILPSTIKNITGCVWEKVFKRDIVERMKLRFPIGLTVEDDDFTFKFFQENPMLYRIHIPLYYYRIKRNGSYTENSKIQIEKDALQIIRNLRNYCIEENIYPQYKEFFLHLLAKRILEIHECENKILYKEALDLLEEFNYYNLSVSS